MSDLTNKTVCHYRVVERLGGGGMGVVYRAEDTKLKRTVALKFLPPELTRDTRAKQRFINEARAVSSLDHPNICTIYSIDETEDGQVFLVLACYEGETAKERLERGPMPIAEALGLAVHVARGLDEAHAKNIIHRDIKPANVFITNGGRAKILDFGLAKLAGQIGLTKPGSAVGTVSYMSPEQAEGREVGARSDIWSLGVVLYEVLTGDLPFQGDSTASVLYSVVHSQPEPLRRLRSDVPQELADVVMKCLEKDPRKRYRNAREVVDALEPLRHGASASSEAITLRPTARIPVTHRTHRGLIAAAAAIVVCAAALALPQVRSAVGAWVGGARMPELKQVAVLPFSRDGSEGTDDAFARGMHRYLTQRLGMLEQYEASLRVIPAGEVYRHEVSGPRDARGVTGATLALTGQVAHGEGAASIELTLVDTKSRRALGTWTKSDVTANVAALQEDPVEGVVQLLDLDLGRRARREITEGGTTVPGAFEAYVAGLGRLWAAEEDSTDHIGDAITHLERATELDPAFALAHAALSRAHWTDFVETNDRGAIARAEASAGRAVQLGDGLVEPRIVLGNVWTQMEEYEAALAEFRRAVEIDALSIEGRQKLADARAAVGDLALAEATLEELVSLRGSYWMAHYMLGRFYYGRSVFEKAEAPFAEASRLAPDNSWPYIALASVYFETERADEALKMWERSADLEPSREAYSNIGTAYFEEARYADACRQYEKALAEDEDYYVTWGNLAAAYDVTPGGEGRALECYAKAAELAEEELRLDPRDAGLLADLACYRAELGDEAAATELLNRSLEHDPDPESPSRMFRIGLTYETLGRREQALLWIGRALESGDLRRRVETTPGLRDLCTDERYRGMVPSR